ncbi:MAG: MlaD family protein [Planctomycetota bacterium]|nr:MlaD family protein [Planctomycetota bacterium]
MAHSYSSVEVKVGFFAAFCLALFVAMAVTYGKVAPVWRGRQEVRVAFDNVASLRPDAPVRYNGIEVGRVKWMRLLHLDDEALERLMPAVTRRAVDNLPLRPESVKRELREANDEDFPAKCRKALKDQTMIELCLEVLQEGDVKRYKLDDQVRIVTTLLGDTAVEIISGSGAVNLPGEPRLLLGTSGDFFSNLAKSMGEVKDILSSVTDVVGAPERRSFERAQARFGAINERVEQITGLAKRRSEPTMKRFDALSTEMKQRVTEAGDFPEKIRPEMQKTFDNIRAGFTDMQNRVEGVQTEAKAASKDLSADMKAIRENVNAITAQVKPGFEQMRTSLRSAYDRMGGLSQRIDSARDTAGSLWSESEPDFARTTTALKNSLANLSDTERAANENKDLMISNRDAGEYEYNTVLDIYRRYCFATRRIREAGAQLQDTTRSLATRLPPAEAGPALARTALTNARLTAVRKPLDELNHRIEDAIVPEFERKKSAWTETTAPK